MSIIRPRADYEDFLYHEAALLDGWQLDEWLALFVEGASYEVPTAGGEAANSAESLFYIADDWFRLQHRVGRLLKPGAHSEQPRSHGLRMISNVRVLGKNDEGSIKVSCAFITYRSINDKTQAYYGHHHYWFNEVDGALRIAYKRSCLAMDSLRPQGRISIIV